MSSVRFDSLKPTHYRELTITGSWVPTDLRRRLTSPASWHPA
jgi:hypothetical protein